ncbi:hypothetical protein V6N13_091613 [Hibiscus sabdariffa]
MGFGCMLKEVALFAVMLTLIATSVAAQSKPGCQSQCGNISIPYPFGTGNGCNISSDFFIRCNTTLDPPKAFLTLTQPDTIFVGGGFIEGDVEVQVLHISLDGYVRISTGANIGSDCYSSSGRDLRPSSGFSYITRELVISHTRNKLTAIGCDTIAYIGSFYKGPFFRQQNFSTGCLTFCSSVADVIPGSCSGIGCCQTAIPKGLRGYEFNFDSPGNHSSVLSFNPCSYGFVVEDGAYDFSVSDLNATDFSKREFPLILDWTVGQQNCTEAQRDPQNYACKENSDCTDPDNNEGYLCKCADGFQGNPYLACQDINECETLKPCSVRGTCHNTPGSYSCSCPTGFEGDGWRNGTGCTPTKPGRESPFILALLVLGSSLGLLVLSAGVRRIYKILQRRRNNKLKQKLFERNGGLLFQKKLSSNEGGLDKAKLFSSKELEAATDQYNENRILGRGGQGLVYKGMLPDGRIVAVKKSKTVNEGFLEQFINEIAILSQIDHRNVVKLLGCCLETEVPLLVYEFIPNGTLSHFIHDQNEEYPRSWDMRLRIAAEVARQKAVSTFGSEEVRGLVSYFMSAMEENRLLDIIDFEIGRDGLKDEVVAVAQLAERCLNLDGRLRPTMKEVAMELERLRTRPGDFVPTDQPIQSDLSSSENWDTTSFSTEYNTCSITSTSQPDVRPLMLDTI